jgi:hypothetical protein
MQIYKFTKNQDGSFSFKQADQSKDISSSFGQLSLSSSSSDSTEFLVKSNGNGSFSLQSSDGKYIGLKNGKVVTSKTSDYTWRFTAIDDVSAYSDNVLPTESASNLEDEDFGTVLYNSDA